ncbi:MAG TPA: aspartate/glutamate racemase family protein [Candidatus Limnocylindria bacterium]
MSRLVHGGRTLYGHAVGILMLDTLAPRLPGDVGNALTWPFPVRYRIVKGADPSRIMGQRPDPGLLAPFVDAARELEAEGVRAITTSCGFLAVYQPELASAVGVPMLTSALLQVPLAARLIRKGQRVGILTERPNLTERHFEGVGWSSRDIPVVVQAMPADAVFPTVYIDNALVADPAVLEREMIDAAEQLVLAHPEVGAIVLECTNFVPFAQAIRRATGRPVLDLYTLVVQTYLATAGTSFPAGRPSSAAEMLPELRKPTSPRN